MKLIEMFAAGQNVQIGPDSHVDHGISEEQMQHVLRSLGDGTADVVVGPFGTFFIATVDLGGLGTAPCALHGPATGEPPVPEEEVEYAKRGNRPNESRLTSRPPTRSSKVTAIVSGGVLITAFGGPLAPKEPGDPSLKPGEKAESEAFWSQHALSK
jgi:hypothetical protein